jgi:hypothetical protein
MATMHRGSKTLAVLFAPHTQQIAILDVSTLQSSVAPAKRKIYRGPGKYLGILIALLLLITPQPFEGASTPRSPREVSGQHIARIVAMSPKKIYRDPRELCLH